MSKITTTPPALTPAAASAGSPPRPTRPPVLRVLKQGLAALASLRLTVVLFVLSLVLVFSGTLAQRDEGIWTVVNDYFRSFFVWIPLRNLLFVRVPGGFPYPGGLVIGGALLLNLLAAHLVRFKLSWRRSGILALHAGLILLLVGELITRFFAVEGNMTIEANGFSNYLEDREYAELAVIDPSNPTTDDVVVIPNGMLRAGGVIRHDALPFDVEVLTYMLNSSIQEEVAPGADNPATAGDGRQVLAVPRPPVSGADPNQKVDLASAYVTFRKKDGGEPLGTYLVSVWLSALGDRPNQTVAVDGKTYEVVLRFKRTYRPYTIHLLEFKHDVYDRTDIARNFSSLVRLDDPSRGESRQTLVYMNNPLRYHGETFYQSGFLPGDTGTILQVVRNPGWLLPYFACTLVAVGMLVHFGITLVGFVRKRMAQLAADPGKQPGPEPDDLDEPDVPLGTATPAVAPVLPHAGQFTAARPARPMAGRFAGSLPRKATRTEKAAPVPVPNVGGGLARFAPWIAVGVGVVYLLAAMAPVADPPGQFQLEEFAGLPVMDRGRVKPLDTFARTSLMVISDRQTFKDLKGNTQPAVRWLLDVMCQADAAHDYKVFRIENDQVLGLLDLKPREGLRYSVNEIAGKVNLVAREATRAKKIDAPQRDVFDVKILELANKLETYINISQLSEPGLIPPPQGGREWRSLREALAYEKQSGAKDPDVRAYRAMLAAYAGNDVKGFNAALAAYRGEVDAQAGAASQKAGVELFFNNFAPFYQCAVLYVFVFVLGCLSWVGWSRPLSRAAFGLAVVTLVVHTAALVMRMYIQGRPPVTNLYSSAIFIGWAGVGVCLALEALFRNGICVVLAAVSGAVTMLIAHLLASGDTLEVLQAVLDTNFWLATHVTCVTLGYSATYVAGLFGMAYILCAGLSLVVPSLDRGLLRSLAQIVYGVVCFATLFSFTGTVLGGIWADQSWGRFWGWDPKENGALLIVIWNALILHARWGGLVKARGVAVLAVLGNIITSWSWFGTNMLGVGLHSYGFMAGAFWGLLGAVVFFLLWALAGVALPRRAWR
jgi:ABC-type transport system involved in cytochrome c biogenesis permease subunit